jgi:hypothetical protein
LATKLSRLQKNYFGHTTALSFYRFQKILIQPNNLTAFSVSSKTFVPAQKPILLNANHLFVWHKMFVTATIYKFGPAQNILGPVKGQDMFSCQ